MCQDGEGSAQQNVKEEHNSCSVIYEKDYFVKEEINEELDLLNPQGVSEMKQEQNWIKTELKPCIEHLIKDETKKQLFKKETQSVMKENENFPCDKKETLFDNSLHDSSFTVHGDITDAQTLPTKGEIFFVLDFFVLLSFCLFVSLFFHSMFQISF